MIKRFLLLISSLIIASTPVQARDHRYYNYPRYEQRHDDTSLIIGMLLLNTIIQQQNNRQVPFYYRVPNRPTYCYRELTLDMYGRPYYRTVCE